MLEISDIVFLVPSLSQEVFGPFDDGPDTGTVVLFEGGMIIDIITGELFSSGQIIGWIAASDYSNDAVIIQVETGFIGWIAKDQYRVLNLVAPDSNTVHE